ncbi:nitroreductase family protein [Anaerocolumna xylanovorans]|uniref:Nitroreductase n=1 Tax=Anaerocolumna xylanovorans DSM 12503 TaxID=1121345 RepID=A0A1M7XWH3_9FIRM|nr:nitroreductase family protein [Anaerocolumna xylanovorans]SHO43080.1 Nitroreductase [Anaerocolumna xylanovorans DSM 12503]
METLKAMALRKSVRAYKDEQIAEEKLETILSAGCAAPVGMARYDSLHLTVIQDKEVIKKVSESIMQMLKRENDPLYGARTLILVSSQEMPAPGLDYTNASCVMENMLLTGADLGIGSVIVWGIALAVEANESLKEALSIPEGFKPLIGACFGYAADTEQKEKELTVKIQSNRV